MDGRDPSIELANTIRRSGRRRVDLLGSPADLATWLDAVAPEVGSASAETSLRLADFRGLRDAVRSVFEAIAAGAPVAAEAVETVNAASAAMPAHTALDASDPRTPVAVDVRSAGSRTGEILALIARSAIRVAGGPDRERLRACGECGRFFLAARPRQVWCGPACGNRARVRRHHERRRSDAPHLTDFAP